MYYETLINSNILIRFNIVYLFILKIAIYANMLHIKILVGNARLWKKEWKFSRMMDGS